MNKQDAYSNYFLLTTISAMSSFIMALAFHDSKNPMLKSLFTAFSVAFVIAVGFFVFLVISYFFDKRSQDNFMSMISNRNKRKISNIIMTLLGLVYTGIFWYSAVYQVWLYPVCLGAFFVAIFLIAYFYRYEA